MGRRIDLVGQKFGFLTAVKFIKAAKAGTYWELSCVCGNKVVRLASNIKKNHVHSCGCKPNRPAKEGAGFKRLFSDYRASARNRGYIFDIEESHFKKLIESNCHYCDVSPTKRYEKQVVHTLLANGIDRVDNNIGYTQENSIACCKNCNKAKGSLSKKEFLTLIGNIYNNRVRR